ncbi:uncharacterized protein BDV17DRAFT_30784 [Aspergillus undulatus]|uniref:uncharacterized protein n=1 Tax=Aspergillus undulatus TaxID=1810928 RepID=UPI003CCDAA4C
MLSYYLEQHVSAVSSSQRNLREPQGPKKEASKGNSNNVPSVINASKSLLARTSLDPINSFPSLHPTARIKKTPQRSTTRTPSSSPISTTALAYVLVISAVRLGCFAPLDASNHSEAPMYSRRLKITYLLSLEKSLLNDIPPRSVIRVLNLNILLNRSYYLCINMLGGFVKLLAEMVDCIDRHCYRDWVSARGIFIICQGFMEGFKRVCR